MELWGLWCSENQTYNVRRPPPPPPAPPARDPRLLPRAWVDRRLSEVGCGAEA
jgi:hypothetical protein